MQSDFNTIEKALLIISRYFSKAMILVEGELQTRQHVEEQEPNVVELSWTMRSPRTQQSGGYRHPHPTMQTEHPNSSG